MRAACRCGKFPAWPPPRPSCRPAAPSRGAPLDELSGAAAREAALKVQMIFQDPMSSLNPRLRVTDIIGEAPVVHGIVARRERDDYVAALLGRVGLDARYARRYPHQFSG